MEIKILGKNQSLSYLAGINRPIKPTQVTKLAQSLLLMGNIRPLVIATISFINGKATKYIIDGQHLFNALIRNNMPIEYVEITINDHKHLVEVIAMLNSSSKSWMMLDYIVAWASISQDYKKLLHYYNVYDFELNILANVLSGRNVAPGHVGGPSKMLKKGVFKITDEQFAIKLLDNLTDVLKIIPRMDRQQNTYTCAEYINFFRITGARYKHEHFLENLEHNKRKFTLATQEPNKLTEMFTKLL